MYAVLDIETTGGKYNEEAITEIAIHKFNGHEIVDSFISLLNPERPIQPFVVNLTGINNNMLRNAPKFYEVAKRIVEITEECVLVAHNSKFDYRMLRTEFKRLGYDYKRETVCTVELSKKLIPHLASYKLGTLCRTLGIPVADRHRANGDAIATTKLFELLLEKDTSKSILINTITTTPKTQLDPKLLDIIEEMPNKTGVYYMHNKAGEIIYIGKSKNIKKRINQHFTNTRPKAKKIQEQVANVSYKITGSELVALLKESEEIKRNKPVFNRAQRRTIFTHALYSFTDKNGYINLTIDKADRGQNPITTFANRMSAKSHLFKMADNYKLCQKLTGLYPAESSCFNYTINACDGACIGEEPPGEYNKRVESLIAKHSFNHKNLLIIDRGKEIDENYVILIENGVFKGLGAFNLNYQITNIEVLKTLITPMKNDRDTQHIIKSYLRRKKVKKIITF